MEVFVPFSPLYHGTGFAKRTELFKREDVEVSQFAEKLILYELCAHSLYVLRG